MEERAGSFHGQEFDPPPPVQTRNPTPFRRPTYPQSGGGCRLGCPAFLLPPFLPPPESETLGPVQRGKADFPQPPGGVEQFPPLALALRAPLRDRPRAGGLTSRGGLRIETGGGKAKTITLQPPNPPPCFPQLTHVVCSGSFSKRWVLDTGFSTKGCHRRRFGRDASRGRRGGVGCETAEWGLSRFKTWVFGAVADELKQV